MLIKKQTDSAAIGVKSQIEQRILPSLCFLEPPRKHKKGRILTNNRARTPARTRCKMQMAAYNDGPLAQLFFKQIFNLILKSSLHFSLDGVRHLFTAMPEHSPSFFDEHHLLQGLTARVLLGQLHLDASVQDSPLVDGTDQALNHQLGQ